MAEPTRRATCSCGKLIAICEGEPVRSSMCHCFACQKRTGSAFGIQARFATDKVKIDGPFTEYVRVGDSGGTVRFRFCPSCGTTLAWEIDKLEGFVAIAVGAFADPTFPAPKVAVYEARRHPWAAMPGLDVEHYD